MIAAHLEVGTLIELAHVINGHDRAAVQRLSHRSRGGGGRGVSGWETDKRMALNGNG
jgi:hypothetical protein